MIVLGVIREEITWLLVNLGTAILASLVISLFDATLSKWWPSPYLCLLLPRWVKCGHPDHDDYGTGIGYEN